ncbi:hypothetical protein OG900_22235 [Streptomyces sp. NBC_00433]
MPEDRQGDGGRKKQQWWAPAERRIGAGVRFLVAVLRVLKDLLDIAGFIGRHL